MPAISFGKILCKQNIDVCLIGKGLSKYSGLLNASIPFFEIDSANFISKNPLQSIKAIKTIQKGYQQSKIHLETFRPDIVIGFGSYHSLPILLATLRKKVPLFLHEQNVMLGRVNKLFSYFAKGIGCAMPLKNYKKPKACLVHVPRLVKKDSNDSFKKLPNNLVICIVGGSLGSHQLNKIAPKAMVQLKKDFHHIQVIHSVGLKGNLASTEQVYQQAGLSYFATNFEPNLGSVLAQADIVISRAGATILDELIYYNTPAVLVPFTGAYGHQQYNADYFCNEIQGGFCIKESVFTVKSLVSTIQKMLEGDTLKEMRSNLHTYYLKQKSFKSFNQLIQECL